ncbi:MAG: hypothetical protein WCG97_03650 [bacterium]
MSTVSYFQHRKSQAAKDAEERKKWEDSVEGTYLRENSPTQVDPRYRPILIYRYRGEGARPAYSGVGTVFKGKDGLVVATVEHLLSKDSAKELFVIRFLSPDEQKSEIGLESVAHRNVEVGIEKEADVVFLRLGTAAYLDCFSERSASVPVKAGIFLFGDLSLANGQVVKKLKSLVTGKEYPVVGSSKNPKGILIRHASRIGESGTGFVDEYGNLYVMTGGEEKKDDPVTIVSGPFMNLEGRL